MNECVSWTVDIPVAELPDLPPLPSGIQEKFDDVLARTALQQPTWDQKQADTVRKILESVPPIVVAPEIRELKNSWPMLRWAARSSFKAGTARRRLSRTQNPTSAPM